MTSELGCVGAIVSWTERKKKLLEGRRKKRTLIEAVFLEDSALKSDVNYVALKLKSIEEELKRESAASMVGFDNSKQPVSVLGTGKG